MARKQLNKQRLTEIVRTTMNEPAEMPKKEYADPKPEKKVDRVKLEADLADLLYSAGGQAPGYRRQLNKILDQHL